MLRLGYRHPGFRCSSETCMESEHLVELPNRAVAQESDLGNERGRPTGSTLGLVSAWVPLAVASVCRPAVLRPRPGPANRPASPCAWLSCRPLAHFVALEITRLLHVGPEGNRSLFLAPPTLPASSRVSTAATYSGRSPASIRGTSATGASAAVGTRFELLSFPDLLRPQWL
jgi:hypothetical protein